MQPDVPALLAALGSTPDEVAEKLRKEGCKGKLKTASECPVAIYLMRHGVKCPTVGAGFAMFLKARISRNVNLPMAVHEFVIALDHGNYPDLIAEQS